MITLKTTIIYIPLIVSLYYFVIAGRLRFHYSVILMGLVAIVQVLTVLPVPRPFAGVDLFFSVAHPFTNRPSFDYFPRLGDSIVNYSRIIAHVTNPYMVGTVLLFIWAMVKFFIVPMGVLRSGGAAPNRRNIVRGVEVFLLVSLLGWVFIRHGQHGTTHQIWVIYSASALVIVALMRICSVAGRGRWRIGVIAAAALYIALGEGPWKYVEHPNSAHYGGMTYTELHAMPPEKVLTLREGEAPATVGVRALLLGSRLLAKDVPPEYSGILHSIVKLHD